MVAAGLFSLKIYHGARHRGGDPAADLRHPGPGHRGGVRHAAGAAACRRPEYASLAHQGRNATAVSVWNALWVSLAFGAGWLLTLPFWLIPPMAVILSVFWWAFAFTRMLRLDAIVEHASPAERAILLKRHNSGFWLIGLVCSLLNLLPPAWIILPVFSGLVYVHYGLDALQRLRQERTIDV